jgi:transcriptional regulator with XRE-family HTH domain
MTSGWRHGFPEPEVATPHPRPPAALGLQLRGWRQRRRLTQFDLAGLAETSTRHISFIETGRSLPSRAMLIRLAERLDVPLRERNVLLTAAGLAPMYPERRLDHPAMRPAHEAVRQVLKLHEPFPAIAVDRHWNVLAANAASALLLQGAASMLRVPPVNVLRLCLHPDGIAPRIANYHELRAYLLHRLRDLVDRNGDAVLRDLYTEISAYPSPSSAGRDRCDEPLPAPSIAIPLQLDSDWGRLSFISTITVFGSPMDVTLAELAVETFFPADEFTADVLRNQAGCC